MLLSLTKWFAGITSLTAPFEVTLNYFDESFTFSGNLKSITCCHPDNTIEVRTCGQGASCRGQCSALGASLCPSGVCTDDPETCKLGINDHNHGSTDTLSPSQLDWCTNSKHQCSVKEHPDCCYNVKCLDWRGVKEACSWLNYLNGNVTLSNPEVI